MWKQINLNDNNISHVGARAVLIKCPASSAYKGYEFWYPLKLIAEGKHSASLTLSYNDASVFTLKKYGKGRFNSRDIVNEKTITATEFESLFKVIDLNITEKNTDPSVPPVLQAHEVEANAELLDTD